MMTIIWDERPNYFEVHPNHGIRESSISPILHLLSPRESNLREGYWERITLKIKITHDSKKKIVKRTTQNLIKLALELKLLKLVKCDWGIILQAITLFRLNYWNKHLDSSKIRILGRKPFRFHLVKLFELDPYFFKKHKYKSHIRFGEKKMYISYSNQIAWLPSKSGKKYQDCFFS